MTPLSVCSNYQFAARPVRGTSLLGAAVLAFTLGGCGNSDQPAAGDEDARPEPVATTQSTTQSTTPSEIAAEGLDEAGAEVAAAGAECGKVTLADMNWSSATLIANVDQFILEHGFGCDAELVPGDTVPTGTSMMEKGEPDVASELWTNSFGEQLQAGVDAKQLRIAGPTFKDGGEEGFWVPKYMFDEDPSLSTIEGVIAAAKKFPNPEDSSKSAFYGCPSGWVCETTASNNFRALGLDDAGFELINPGSGAGLAGSIAKAYERKEPWFGYYWAPTAILGKYDMVLVDFGTGVDEDYYKSCTSVVDCQAEKATMFPSSPVRVVTTEQFATESPEAFGYLASRSFTNDALNDQLAWMEDNQADGEIAAMHFLKNSPDLWKSWLDDDVAAKVEAALPKGS